MLPWFNDLGILVHLLEENPVENLFFLMMIIW